MNFKLVTQCVDSDPNSNCPALKTLLVSSEDSDRSFSRFGIDECYIYNPTTNHYVKLPKPGIVNGVPRFIRGVNVAFDHAKFASYSVVCVRESAVSSGLMQIEIYSTTSREWRVSGDPFSAKVDFDYGVYWNGSIHWIQYMTGEVLYFNVDQERLGVVPMVNKPKPDGKWGRKLDYFGESCDHLHLIESYDSEIEFNVYEMKRDYSEWFVKYKVDLTIVADAFPEVTSKYAYIDRVGYLFSVFSLVRGVKEEDSFLVFLIASRVFRFNLERQTFEEIYEFATSVRCPLRFMGPCAFEYIESLAGV
ncbi:hypothetical protein BUALT_Bualt01G0062400 [Buddleja alternifolia]|uniref:F-box protein n=1 Tax=Buddleja alternifolia TaxID=168488 RepID=A0AAV6YCQ8_9LAMI|nr:hypothetical protein BUALT_Bualt01G0062400 [Buddleja alternifolia]